MKKQLTILFSSILVINVFGQESFEFVNSTDGYSYIQINENIESFTFTPDWHSLGNAGKVGYVIYTSDMNAEDRATYMEANANNPQFGKKINNGIVNFGPLNTGDKVGFYEERPNGSIYTHTSFEDWKDETWLAFDKNGGHGKDEWMSISGIQITSSEAPNGAPLPGVLAIIFAGGIGATMLKKKK